MRMTGKQKRELTFFFRRLVLAFAHPRPLIDALADELPQIFKLVRRLVPKILEHAWIEIETVCAARASLRSHLIFEIGRELTASHGHDRERTACRQRFKELAHTLIEFLQAREHAIVLFDAERSRVLTAASPL